MKFQSLYDYNKFKNELYINIAKRKGLTKQIKKLPPDIQKKIYIYSYKIYWKHKALRECQVPEYYKDSLTIKKQMYDGIFNNIHFLHLDMNTKPEYKKWIMGCQCEYCLNENKNKRKEKIKIYNDYINSENKNYFFNKHINCYDYSYYSNKWLKVCHMMDDNDNSILYFNPLFKFPINNNPRLQSNDYPIFFNKK